MLNQKFRELLQSKGIPQESFEIPRERSEKCAELELRRFCSSNELGDPSSVAVYDKLPLEEVIKKIKSSLGSNTRCVDFSYEQTIGKKRVQTSSLGNNLTIGLLSHLFTAEETEYNEKTLILYHTFNDLIEVVADLFRDETIEPSLVKLYQTNEIVTFLDAGCGRGWRQGHAYRDTPRLSKMSGNNPLIRSALVMSIDEKIANNWYVGKCTENTRAMIGLDHPEYYIF